MNILHTSDWHIGRTLYSRKRYDEHDVFLNWLAEIIDQEQIDVLLVAGDVFDTSAPSNRAQEIYYRFLCRVALSSCRHVVLVAGNHDSPSFLSAPKELLRNLNIHVIGAAAENLHDEVLVLTDSNDCPELLVCAVPYLRDRDIRLAEAGESIDDKEQKLIAGIRHHYQAVCTIAREKRRLLAEQYPDRLLPMIATGHLFAAGGQTVDGDGVRELYVGSLAHVSAGIFPADLDYLALGHLHVPQKVNGSEIMRYSGSPLPMGFGEAGQTKHVVLVQFPEGTANRQPAVTSLPVPVVQRLERITGPWHVLAARIQQLALLESSVWLEIVYDGEEVFADLRERLDAAVAGTNLEILRVKNTRIVARVLSQVDDGETLDDLDSADVFDRCLAAHNVPEEQRSELLHAYGETLLALAESGAALDL
jgi:DNA repair protein SbcD/Mre11